MTSERDQYREGEDVTSQVAITKEPGMVVSVRLEGDEARQLRRYARDTERTVSEVARLAIRNFFEAEAAAKAASSLNSLYMDGRFIYGHQTDSRTSGKGLTLSP